MSGKAKGSEAPAAGSAEELDDTLCEVWYCDACKSTLDAAYARGLERAAQLALLHGDGLSGEELAEAMREEARALAGTETLPPPDARVRELEGLLREALYALDDAAPWVVGLAGLSVKGTAARLRAALASLDRAQEGTE